MLNVQCSSFGLHCPSGIDPAFFFGDVVTEKSTPGQNPLYAAPSALIIDGIHIPALRPGLFTSGPSGLVPFDIEH